MKWFRMYTSLVDSIKVGPLKDGEFRVYIEMLCLAGEKSDAGRTGVTKDNINWRLRRDVTSDVTAVVTSGLVTVGDDGEYVVSDWDARQARTDSSAERTRTYRERKAKSMNAIEKTGGDGRGDAGDGHGDGVEKIRGEESREEKGDVAGRPAVIPPCPAEELVALYHACLPLNPACKVLSEARRGAMRARWRQFFVAGKYSTVEEGLSWWTKLFQHAATSKFLTGQAAPRPGRAPWVADIDFLFSPSGVVGLIEGKYHEEAA